LGFSYRGDGVFGGAFYFDGSCCMEGPRPPPTSPSAAPAKARGRAEAWAHGLRAAAAELTKAPTVRRAQEASGRRLQGANGRAQASGTKTQRSGGVVRGPPTAISRQKETRARVPVAAPCRSLGREGLRSQRIGHVHVLWAASVQAGTAWVTPARRAEQATRSRLAGQGWRWRTPSPRSLP
jgi:hypothetical protein